MDFDIIDLTEHTMSDLADKLSDWQKNAQFMRFLKDIPMSPKENLQVIQDKLTETGSIHKLIIQHTKQEIIGSVLFDQFNNEDMSLESYTRVDPSFQG